MDAGGSTGVGASASLPLDLLLNIFRRLESTAVIRCAGVCRPWRRVIIGNASFLRPRPDCFLPNLLLGVFHGYGNYDHQHLYLRRTPGPFQSALPSTGAAGSSGSRIQSLIPATGGFDREMYTDLLSSRDGFILLRGRRWWSGVCLLCNPMTGYSKILPDATLRSCTYILLTGYDDLSPSVTGHADGHLAVRILAVAGTGMTCTEENRITYQVFSFASGSGNGGAEAWGPVKRSMKTKTGFRVPVYEPCTVVSGNTVYWLGGPKGPRFVITSAVALDVRTGRAWTMELPQGRPADTIFASNLLATSGDGRLSLIRSLCTKGRQQIQVWVLTGDDQWNLQKTIVVQVQKLLPSEERLNVLFNYRHVRLNAFCPRSGCVIGMFDGQEIRIDLEGTCVEWIGTREGYYWNNKTWIWTSEPCYCNNTYEMDWSTYISKMKQF